MPLCLCAFYENRQCDQSLHIYIELYKSSLGVDIVSAPIPLGLGLGLDLGLGLPLDNNVGASGRVSGKL